MEIISTRILAHRLGLSLAFQIYVTQQLLQVELTDMQTAPIFVGDSASLPLCYNPIVTCFKYV